MLVVRPVLLVSAGLAQTSVADWSHLGTADRSHCYRDHLEKCLELRLEFHVQRTKYNQIVDKPVKLSQTFPEERSFCNTP